MGDGEKWTNGKFRKKKICISGFLMIFHFCQHSENWRPKLWGGSVIGNFSVRSILKKWQPSFNFFIMAKADILFPSTLGIRDPNFGGSVIRNFSVRLILKKWQPFFNFFIMADVDILFPSTLGKPETQTMGGLVIENFSVRLILKKWQPFFNFFIMADADISHSEIQRHKNLVNSVFWTFPLVQFSPSPIIGSFHHLCVDIYAWWPFCTSEKCQNKFSQNRLTHLCIAVVNRLGNSSSHQKYKIIFLLLYRTTSRVDQMRITWNLSISEFFLFGKVFYKFYA